MSKIDKVDVVEFLSGHLDDTKVEGLGSVLAAADDMDGTLILQTWPDGDDQPGVDFRVRVTKLRATA